jgi:hypothetical protein
VTTELALSIGALVAELALLAYFWVQSRKPPDPARIRVFPYNVAIIVVTLLIFLTLAHIVSLVTGTQVQPRRPKGMR